MGFTLIDTPNVNLSHADQRVVLLFQGHREPSACSNFFQTWTDPVTVPREEDQPLDNDGERQDGQDEEGSHEATHLHEGT